MATQILRTDLVLLLPRPGEAPGCAERDYDCEFPEEEGSPFRGLFFAMIFNVLLLIVGAAGWELWRLIP